MNAVQRYTKALAKEPRLRIRRLRSLIGNGSICWVTPDDWLTPDRHVLSCIYDGQRLTYPTFTKLLCSGAIVKKTEIKIHAGCTSVMYGPPTLTDEGSQSPVPGQGSAGAGEGRE